jgi:hypothetical protein
MPSALKVRGSETGEAVISTQANRSRDAMTAKRPGSSRPFVPFRPGSISPWLKGLPPLGCHSSSETTSRQRCWGPGTAPQRASLLTPLAWRAATRRAFLPDRYLLWEAAHNAGLAIACSTGRPWPGKADRPHRLDFGIPELLRLLSDNCPKRHSRSAGDPYGVHCQHLPAFSRASPRQYQTGGPPCGSVAAFDLHGLTIRVRVARAGVGWRLLRHRV